jgi:subtilase-type serine protease
MNGTGELILGGANTYTGTTQVQAGTLIYNGSTSTPVIVDAGATLGGTGSVGAVTVNGIVSPGHQSIGTLTGASFSFNAGSEFMVEFNSTTSDQVVATGNVTINPGSTLTLVPLGFSSVQVPFYTLITAGSVTEVAPFMIKTMPARFSARVEYDPTRVLLFLEMVPFTALFPHGNLSGVAHCLDSLSLISSADMVEILDVLNNQTLSQLKGSLDQMQPGSLNGVALAQENVAERIRQIYTEHLYEQRLGTCSQNSWRLWATPFLESAHQKSQGHLLGYTEVFGGFNLGVDYLAMNHWAFSEGFSYANSNVDISDKRAHAEFNTYAGTVATAWNNRAWRADALFSYLHHQVAAHRNIHLSVTTPMFSSSFKHKARQHEGANEVLGHLGGSYQYNFSENSKKTVALRPFFTLDYLFIQQNKYVEHGAESLDLTVHRKKNDLLRPEVGLGFGYSNCEDRKQWLVDLSASFVQEFRFIGKKTKAGFKAVPCTFEVKGLLPQNSLFCPTVRFGRSSDNFSLTVGYHGEFGSRFIENEGEIELKVLF